MRLASFHPAILVGSRSIAEGDEARLLPQELAGFAASAVSVRRQSGAARSVARELMERLGVDGVPIPRGPARAPVWPDRIAGSLAHCCDTAIAAVASRAEVLSVGIDIEPNAQLPDGVAERVATQAERSRYSADILSSRRLFVIKEAVYKAVFPLDRQALDFCDAEIDLDGGVARLSNGRVIAFAESIGRHIVALAHIPAR